MTSISKLVVLVLSFLVPTLCLAGTVEEKAISNCATAHTVSVATNAWTQITSLSASTRQRQRSGVKLSNPSVSSASVVGVLSQGSPSEATTIRPIEIEPGENPFIPIHDSWDLYLFSLNDGISAESVHAQECKQ